MTTVLRSDRGYLSEDIHLSFNSVQVIGNAGIYWPLAELLRGHIGYQPRFPEDHRDCLIGSASGGRVEVNRVLRLMSFFLVQKKRRTDVIVRIPTEYIPTVEKSCTAYALPQVQPSLPSPSSLPVETSQPRGNLKALPCR